MTQIKIFAAIFATAGILGATAVMARPGCGSLGPRMQFEEIDTDGNGEVSKAEMEAHKTARFTSADSDGDGKLSAEEMLAMAMKRAEMRTQMMIQRFDKDGDGALSESELPTPGRRGDMFKRMDADASGGISKDEFAVARKKHGGMRPGGNFGGCNFGGPVEQN